VKVSRRQFMALGLGAVAWACGGSKKRPAAAPHLNITPVTTELAVGDKRMSFALFTNDQKPYDKVRTARVSLKPPAGEARAVDARLVSVRFGGGEADDEGAEVHDIFVFGSTFDAVGLWTMNVVVAGQRLSLPMQVLDRSDTLMIGQKALPSQSPTTSDARGVNPLCTRTPPCSMHDRTIAQALAMGKPSVIVFATPKFCTSRTCGPLVDVIEGVKAKTADRVSFVHVEIWKDDQSVGQEGSQAPVVKEWNLPADPFVFFVGSDGAVKDRWSGAAGESEIQQAVDKLVAGAL
jgi:hypothetical protein